MIDSDFYEGILEKFRGVDCSSDENGVCNSNELTELVNETVADIWNNHSAKIADSLYCRLGVIQDKNYFDSELLRTGFFFHDFLANLVDYLSKRRDHWTEADKTINNVSSNCFSQIAGILLLHTTKDFIGVIAKFRSLFEAYITLKILIERPALSSIFQDHAAWKQHKLYAFISRSMKKIAKAKQAEQAANTISGKYSKVFEGNYGWAYPLFPQKKSQIFLQELVDYFNFEDFQYLYKMSCEFVHMSPFTIATSSDLSDLADNFFMVSIALGTEVTLRIIKTLTTADDELIPLRNIIRILRDHSIGT